MGFPILQCTPDILRSCVSRHWIYRGRMLDPIFCRPRVRWHLYIESVPRVCFPSVVSGHVRWSQPIRENVTHVKSSLIGCIHSCVAIDNRWKNWPWNLHMRYTITILFYIMIIVLSLKNCYGSFQNDSLCLLSTFLACMINSSLYCTCD